MKEKLSILTELIKLTRCDDNVQEEEYLFLLSVAETLKVSKEEFDQLFENYSEFAPAKSEFERILQFHRLVLLMNIDKESSDSEIIFLKDIAIRLGLSPKATNQVLTEMHKYPNKIVPSDRLIEIFKEQYS